MEVGFLDLGGGMVLGYQVFRRGCGALGKHCPFTPTSRNHLKDPESILFDDQAL